MCKLWGSGCCPITALLMWAGWAVVASTFLYFTWNRVVKALVNVKQAKFWQALLVIVTLSVFCAPRYLMHKGGHWGRGSGYHSCCFWKNKKDCKGCHENQVQEQEGSAEQSPELEPPSGE